MEGARSGSRGANWPPEVGTPSSAARAPRAPQARHRPAPGVGWAWVVVAGALYAVRALEKRPQPGNEACSSDFQRFLVGTDVSRRIGALPRVPRIVAQPYTSWGGPGALQIAGSARNGRAHAGHKFGPLGMVSASIRVECAVPRPAAAPARPARLVVAHAHPVAATERAGAAVPASLRSTTAIRGSMEYSFSDWSRSASACRGGLAPCHGRNAAPLGCTHHTTRLEHFEPPAAPATAAHTLVASLPSLQNS